MKNISRQILCNKNCNPLMLIFTNVSKVWKITTYRGNHICDLWVNLVFVHETKLQSQQQWISITRYSVTCYICTYLHENTAHISLYLSHLLSFVIYNFFNLNKNKKNILEIIWNTNLLLIIFFYCCKSQIQPSSDKIPGIIKMLVKEIQNCQSSC